MANQFDKTQASDTNDYKGLQLTVEVNGEPVNLGSLFVSNKGATAISKKIFDLIEAGELDASKPVIAIKGIFSSEDSATSDIDASAF